MFVEVRQVLVNESVREVGAERQGVGDASLDTAKTWTERQDLDVWPRAKGWQSFQSVPLLNGEVLSEWALLQDQSQPQPRAHWKCIALVSMFFEHAWEDLVCDPYDWFVIRGENPFSLSLRM